MMPCWYIQAFSVIKGVKLVYFVHTSEGSWILSLLAFVTCKKNALPNSKMVINIFIFIFLSLFLDSYCPPKLTGPTASPKLVTLKPGTNVKAIAQQNFKSMKTHSNSDLQHAAMHGNRHHDTDSLPKEEDSYHSRKQKLRHKTERRRLRRLKHRESMWLQEET